MRKLLSAGVTLVVFASVNVQAQDYYIETATDWSGVERLKLSFPEAHQGVGFVSGVAVTQNGNAGFVGSCWNDESESKPLQCQINYDAHGTVLLLDLQPLPQISVGGNAGTAVLQGSSDISGLRVLSLNERSSVGTPRPPGSPSAKGDPTADPDEPERPAGSNHPSFGVPEIFHGVGTTGEGLIDCFLAVDYITGTLWEGADRPNEISIALFELPYDLSIGTLMDVLFSVVLRDGSVVAFGMNKVPIDEYVDIRIKFHGPYILADWIDADLPGYDPRLSVRENAENGVGIPLASIERFHGAYNGARQPDDPWDPQYPWCVLSR